MKKLILAAAICLTTTTGFASELITKTSPHTVAVTMDRLVAAVEKAGAKVIARVNHTKAAKSIGAEMVPTEMLVFGNPKIGTPIMQKNPAAGLDLPIRVVVYQGDDGKTVVAYHNPSELAQTYSVPADIKALKVMAGALKKLTGAAVAN